MLFCNCVIAVQYGRNLGCTGVVTNREIDPTLRAAGFRKQFRGDIPRPHRHLRSATQTQLRTVALIWPLNHLFYALMLRPDT
jgi:hypothetical protein